MKIYLAARYSRQRELLGYATELLDLGHQITSRWIQGNHQVTDAELSELEFAVVKRMQFASEDLEDLLLADYCISFTEPPRSNASRGGRHVEFGLALGTAKRVLVVGHRENVFHCLPAVEFFATWPEARDAL